MALEIQPTPTLEGGEAIEFLRRLEDGETAPPPEVPTFNHEEALERIREVFGQPEK